MNKAELIAEVAVKTGLSKKDSEKAVNATLDTVTASLKSGEKVSLVGFGVFDVKEREARMGRNPKTKEEIPIPASRVPQFKAGKALKEAVDKKSDLLPKRAARSRRAALFTFSRRTRSCLRRKTRWVCISLPERR